MAFSTIAPPYVSEFRQLANAARQRCRTQEPDRWLGLHTLYPGLARLLRAHAGRLAIVSAKDEPAVRAVLDWHGMGDCVREVIGECRRKDEAVRDLCRRHGISPRDVTFIDDSLPNALAVAATGATAHWAMWGYHTADDLTAAADGVRRLTLADVAALADAA